MNEELCGFIIHHREYREHDAILRILCDDGKLYSIVARGIHKIKSKNAPACQIFTSVRMQINFRENATLQSLKTAEIVKSYRAIREDITKQSIASYVCECIDKSKFEENVFQLVKDSLDILETTTYPLRMLCLFQSIMNRMHGIEPYVDGCVRCGATHAYGISLHDGGFVCKHCYQRTNDMQQSIVQLKRFRLLCKANIHHYDILKTYTDFGYDDFEHLYAFFEDYDGIKVNSIQFLRCLHDIEKRSI